MNRIFICALFLTFGIVNTFAAPSYGPNMPAKKQWDVGYESYAILDKDCRKPVASAKTVQYFANFAFGVNSWFCIDGKMGIGNFSYQPDNKNRINFNTGWAGGYGFRVKCLDKNDYKVVAAFHHISVHPEKRSVNGDEYRLINDDWEFTGIVSKKFKFIEPYIGPKISYNYVSKRENEHSKRIKPIHYFGLLAGFDLNISPNWRINSEVGLFNETSVSGGFNYRF